MNQSAPVWRPDNRLGKESKDLKNQGGGLNKMKTVYQHK